MPEAQVINTYNGQHANMADALSAIPWDIIKSASFTLRNGKIFRLRKTKNTIISYDRNHNLVGLVNTESATLSYFKTVSAFDVTAFHIKEDVSNDD